MNLAPYIRDIADFPKPGIGFKDLTPLLGDARAFADSIEQLIAPFRESKVDCICGIEARGFIFGAAAATGLGCGFVPMRKPGKLPAATISVDYALEYGSDRLEMHVDAIRPGARVLLIDDVLATGGTLVLPEDADRRVAEALATVSAQRGTPLAQVALAWQFTKPVVTAPITVPSRSSRAMRRVTTRVLPDPAPARMSDGTYDDRYGPRSSSPASNTVDARDRRETRRRTSVRAGSVSAPSTSSRTCPITVCAARWAYRCPA